MQVRQYFSEHEDPSKIIAEAFDIFSHLSKEPQSVIRGFVLTNAKELFRKNIEIGDFKAAEGCLKMLLKISESQPVEEDPNEDE